MTDYARRLAQRVMVVANAKTRADRVLALRRLARTANAWADALEVEPNQAGQIERRRDEVGE